MDVIVCKRVDVIVRSEPARPAADDDEGDDDSMYYVRRKAQTQVGKKQGFVYKNVV